MMIEAILQKSAFSFVLFIGTLRYSITFLTQLEAGGSQLVSGPFVAAEFETIAIYFKT
jgi:hypothetical protein